MISDPVFIVGNDGISAPAYDEILEFFKEKARGIFGTDINLDADTQDGQLIAVFALAIHQVNSQAMAAYANFNPATAIGIGLDSAVKVNGLKRRESSASQVDLKIVGQVGTVISNGVAKDSNNRKWLLPESVVIPVTGEITVSAHAEKQGAVAAPAGTITKIATPTPGWQTVTNPLPAVLGIAVETDTELRARQSASTEAPGATLWDGLLGSVMAIDGVTRASGVRNDAARADDQSIPAHSIAVVAEGGDTRAIAKCIYEKKALGVDTYGAVSSTVIDAFGVSHTVKFSRPTVVPITAKITISPEASYLNSVAEEIKSRLAAYVNSLAIGKEVNIGRALASAIKCDDGTMDIRFSVTGITMARKGGRSALSPSSVSIDWDEAASCETADITVEVAS